MTRDCILVGAPMDSGKARQGCLMGPDAFRVAGLSQALRELGVTVQDTGNISPVPVALAEDPRLHALPETVGWTAALMDAAEAAMAEGFPIFLGGDHALSMGTVAGVATHAQAQGRPQFLLWLDAHTDFNTPETTTSGNLHGCPVAYVTGQSGFAAFPPVTAPIPTENVCMMGLRSVDPPERAALEGMPVELHDMRAIDEHGIAAPLRAFLARVAQAGGALHVSFDVDFLDPSIAPAVGTTVPGGATYREAHLVMEMLHESGLVTSLDLVELNPFLDERGRTASLMVELVASLMGRKIFDRPTRPYAGGFAA